MKEGFSGLLYPRSVLLCLGVIGYGHKEQVVSILLQSFGIPALPYLTYGSIYSIILLELYDYCWNIRLWYEGNICISLSSRKLVHYGIAGLCIVVGHTSADWKEPSLLYFWMLQASVWALATASATAFSSRFHVASRSAFESLIKSTTSRSE